MQLNDDDGSAQRSVAAGLGVGRLRRHLLLCCGPRCCSREAGSETWSHLRRRLGELERDGRIPRAAVYRTQVECLRICGGGPILIVYPEGVWYRAVTPQVCERILLEHLGEGRVVDEYVIAVDPLGR